MRKKAENLATKEDIEVITEKVESVKAGILRTGDLYKSMIKVPEKTNMALLEKRMEAIDNISELQRILHELELDHQANAGAKSENREATQTVLSKRFAELFEYFRLLSSFFKAHKAPFLEDYDDESQEVLSSIQSFIDDLFSALPENGGDGKYVINPSEIHAAADKFKQRIFLESAAYERIASSDSEPKKR